MPSKALEVNIAYSRVDVTVDQRYEILQAVIYGWYDNELGSYVNMLGDRTVSVAEVM